MQSSSLSRVFTVSINSIFSAVDVGITCRQPHQSRLRKVIIMSGGHAHSLARKSTSPPEHDQPPMRQSISPFEQFVGQLLLLYEVGRSCRLTSVRAGGDPALEIRLRSSTARCGEWLLNDSARRSHS